MTTSTLTTKTLGTLGATPAIGLGLIVALYRRRLPIDVDKLSELRG